MINQARLHSAIESPKIVKGISVQSAFPLKIIGSVFVKGKFSIKNPTSATQSNVSGGFFSKYTCLIAVMVPKKEKIIVKINNTFEKKNNEKNEVNKIKK